MRRLFIYVGVILLIFLGYSIVNGIVNAIVTNAAPVYHENMRQNNIYAYRSWQSVGLRVKPGESLTIEAEGRWLYTPDDYHGPDGHPRYPAPSFYPVPYGAGGTLIGRIGEKGEPFIVGRWTRQTVNNEGTLYLRINDDILGDNKGSMLVDVTIVPVDPAYR